MISNFRRVLNVVCFLLGDSPAYEFKCPRFGTLCLFHLHRQVRAPKGRHIKFIRWWITQKKAHNLYTHLYPSNLRRRTPTRLLVRFNIYPFSMN